MPDQMVDRMATSSMGPTSSNNAISMGPADPDSLADDESTRLEEPEEAELISVPLLGRRTIVTHQRILFTLLSMALVVLGSVAVFAVRQADTVAQQVAGTGQSLMQSQRLAKSVSQALVGSAQAFPDVKESADVLAKTRARPAQRRRGIAPAAGAGRVPGRRGEDRSADGARREERRHRDGPAEDPDAGGQRPAHHQPPVLRPAGNRRNRVVAQAAAERAPGRKSPQPASW